VEAITESMAMDGTSRKELTFEQMSQDEYEQWQVDQLNKTPGHLNERDGYDCAECMNRGEFYKIVKKNGLSYRTAYDCKCAPTRRSIMRAKCSGIKDIMSISFAKWIATEEWQKTVKQAAQDFAKAPQGWFFIGGQSGCGKTHLCTAICRELLLSGQEVQYMQWRDAVMKLKVRDLTLEQRESLINGFKKAKVLYIDDLFKTGKNLDGSEQRPTSADVNIAFEILNYRYNNPEMVTIISSEFTAIEILDIDEAIGGRLYERSAPLNIRKDKAKNYRLRNQINL